LSDPIDWPAWDAALRRFANATGLLISALDVHGQRRVGPHAGSGFGTLLIDSALFDADGPATHVERDLHAQLVGQPLLDEAALLFGRQLHVRALPIRRGEVTVGAVVFGWVFADFPSSLGCDELARASGLAAHRVWSAARRESPMSAARMTTHTELLAAMVDWGARLGAAAVALERLSLAREHFLAHVSHELRTPLNAIAMRVEALARTADDADAVRRHLEAMRRHVADEAQLVEDLLAAAVTLTGHFTVALVETELTDVIRRAVEAVVPAAEARRVELQVDLGSVPLRVAADAIRLRQALWNVIANAVKFTPERGRVQVRARPTARGHVIEVADEGPGIDPALLSTIFETFVRSPRGNARGLGLGLAIARQIVDQHGGHIAVTAASPAGGALFTVELPALAST
jgi:signal transduction histidine kinase